MVSVTRSVLMKPQPAQVMPYGLARITSARPPRTSVKPASVLRLLATTSLRMVPACVVRFMFAVTWPASRDWRATVSLLPLFSTRPFALTL
ncbi:MAG: hypothetical protein EOP73_02800 [Variovorax sp.]|nr:MAG: hypothetical protein EOP73_02800 [Variovorax sp.]